MNQQENEEINDNEEMYQGEEEEINEEQEMDNEEMNEEEQNQNEDNEYEQQDENENNECDDVDDEANENNIQSEQQQHSISNEYEENPQPIPKPKQINEQTPKSKNQYNPAITKSEQNKYTLTSNEQTIQTIPQTLPNYKHYSSFKNQPSIVHRIKPKFYKLFNQIISTSFDPILNYLTLLDLCNVRSLNHMFLSLIHDYYQRRLKLEISFITSYQEENKEKTAVFMKNIDSQIPISNNNWLDFDLSSVTSKLQLLDRKILTRLRSIKSMGKVSDLVYAPFCIIFGQNKNNNPSTKKDTWKKTATKILSNSNLLLRIADLDLENMSDEEMLNAFVFLNLPELDVENIKRASSDFEKLILWCQGVVSYHIIIHPYIYRNEGGLIGYGTDVFEFANKMNQMIDRFYKFKRFLYNLNIIKIPLADYVFNLQHSRECPLKSEPLLQGINEKLIGNILSYLPLNQSYKMMNVSKKFYKGFKLSIDYIILDIIKELYFIKVHSFDKVRNTIPIMYSNNLFSEYFLMLENLLNPMPTSNKGATPLFFKKENLNELKKIKNTNNIVNAITKIFCLLTNQKPIRKADAKGEIQISYIEKVKLLVHNNSFEKITRNLNKLIINKNNIRMMNKQLSQFNSLSKLEEVKRINKGLYQLLLWELMLCEYLFNYNPFEFMSNEYINNNFSQEHKDIVKYYSEVLDYLKRHLSIKYHFTAVNGKNPSYAFDKHFKNLKECLLKLQIPHQDMEVFFTTMSSNKNDIANKYFTIKKNSTAHKNIPDLNEQIMLQIIDMNEHGNNINPLLHSIESLNMDDNYSCNSQRQLSLIKEENPKLNNQISTPLKQSKLSSPYSHNNNSNINTPHKTPSLSSKQPKSFSPNSNILTLETLNPEIVIINILPYLDLFSLPKFALTSKQCCALLKTHIFLRVFVLKKEKNFLEKENDDIIQSIESKRSSFFNEYEILPPTKEHAALLLGQISSSDIMELKQCFKKENKLYEKVITPLMVLLNEKPKRTILPDGSKVISYYPTTKRVFFNSNFVKRIKDLELELLTPEIFRKVEQIVNEPFFSGEKLKALGPCMCHIIAWVNGVLEYHRAVRKFCLSEYDYGILDEDEIEFCVGMDNVALNYFKLVRYASKHCKEYEKQANYIITKAGIDQE